MEIELSKQKIYFIQNQGEGLVKDEERKAAEHFFKQQEETRIFKQQEHLFFKQQEEARNSREHIFHEWEHLQIHIRELSKALGSETNERLSMIGS